MIFSPVDNCLPVENRCQALCEIYCTWIVSDKAEWLYRNWMIQKSCRNKTYKALLGFCKTIPLIPMFVYKMSPALCLDFNFLLTFHFAFT